MIAHLIANVAAEPMIPGNWITTFVVAVIGAIATAMARNNGRAEGRAQGKEEAMKIGPQPFEIELKEKFVTRREFEKLETRLEVTVTKMEGLFERTMDSVSTNANATQKRIENQNERLTKKIEEVASSAYAARGRIHETTRVQGERIGKLEERVAMHTELSEVAEQIIEAVKNPARIQPVHISNPNG